MCGIYFAAGPIPPFTGSFLSFKDYTLCGIPSARVELPRAEISRIVGGLIEKQTSLKPEDQLKAANSSELREAFNDLERLRNGKLGASGRAERIQQLEGLIAQLKPTENDVIWENSITDHSHKTVTTTEDQLLTDKHQASIINTLARGPDFASYTEFMLHGKHIQILSSVLSLRQPFVAQPVASNPLVLLFNGEIFNEETVSLNDTSFIMSSLEKNMAKNTVEDAVMKTFSALDGEYAFVLLDVSNNRVFFGKDYVGKRSLLFSFTNLGLQIGSVLDLSSAEECKGNVISVVDLSSLTKRDMRVRANPVEKQTMPDNAVKELYIRLKQACSIRQRTIKPLQTKSLGSTSHVAATVAVLFSGGLDCTVVAGLLAENYASCGEAVVIDLLSVGFEHPRTGVAAGESPDRKLSEKSWLELSQRFHSTCVQFRLVHVDVTYREWLAHKQRVFLLIAPCVTEMDLSIAIAFYFAARSTNCVAIEKTPELHTSIEELLQVLNFQKMDFESQKSITELHDFTFIHGYTSASRVLFSGLGADELYGGYSRHESLFNDVKEEDTEANKSITSAAYEALVISLAHDMNVIYERNLGRDDRAMASWGKELRYPYLDETVVEFSLNCIAPDLKMRFWWETRATKKGHKRVKQYERKHILREVARLMCLPGAALETKRAIQFGARSAKLEVGQNKAKGTDRAT